MFVRVYFQLNSCTNSSNNQKSRQWLHGQKERRGKGERGGTLRRKEESDGKRKCFARGIECVVEEGGGGR